LRSCLEILFEELLRCGLEAISDEADVERGEENDGTVKPVSHEQFHRSMVGPLLSGHGALF
jgi:hypothetical protein